VKGKKTAQKERDLSKKRSKSRFKKTKTPSLVMVKRFPKQTASTHLNKYANQGQVPPWLRLMAEGSATGKAPHKLTPYQRKMLEQLLEEKKAAAAKKRKISLF